MSVFQRVEADDPSRCQATHAGYQCPFRATGTRTQGVWEGSQYCPRHLGATQKTWEERKSQNLYLAAKWKERIGDQAEHPKAKSLREELGILRMTLDSRLEQCKDTQDLAMHAGSIINLAREIGALAKTAHNIEASMGYLLDKNQAKIWVQELLSIISNYVTDPEELQMISEDMLASLERRTAPR